MKSLFLTLLTAVSICFAPAVDAKSYGSSSSSRSSSSSSSSRSSSSSSSGWGSSSRPAAAKPTPAPAKPTAYVSPSIASKPSTPGSTAQTSQRVASKVDVKRYETAAKSGKVFQTREAAVADFKTKNASTYTSKYTAEPTSRPTHIPTRYNDRDVIYDRNNGGYGYYSGGGPGLGTFMLYDALSDAAMMNTMMAHQNYYVGPKPVVHTSYSSGWGLFWAVLATIFGVSFIIWLIFFLFKN